MQPRNVATQTEGSIIYALDHVVREEITISNGRVLESNYTGYEEKYLYVNGSGDNYVNRYDVLPDGTLTNGKLFIDLSKETGRGVTDGMRVDTKGNLYETGPGGVWIISPEGKHLGTLLTDKATANVAWGEDGSTLFTTTTDSVYKIHLNTKGKLP